MSDQHASLWLKIIITLIGNIVVMWALQQFSNGVVIINNGLIGLIIVGGITSILNLLIRPILHIITLPLSLFTSILAGIIVNGALLQLTELFTNRLPPALVSLQLDTSILEWILVVCTLGVSNWAWKEITK